MRATLRFVSWNLGCPSAPRLTRQVAFLRELAPDIVALQEVTPAAARSLVETGAFAQLWQALDLRPRTQAETSARDRGCVIAAGTRFELATAPEVLTNAAAPERTLIVALQDASETLTVASFHQVAGSDRKKWGPAKKRQTFEAIARWAAKQERRTLFGIDANSPELDHPDIAQNIYFFDRTAGDQAEHLLHDPTRAPHAMRDAARTVLAREPMKLAALAHSRPDGPVYVSHYNRGRPRRFDFVFATPDLSPVRVDYRDDALTARLSDHAPVVADFGML